MIEKMAELAEKIGKTYLEGEVVFKQGDAGDTMYVIHTGALAVIRETEGTSTVVARLNPGDFVGEMALVDQEPRAASKGWTRCSSGVLLNPVLLLSLLTALRVMNQGPLLF